MPTGLTAGVAKGNVTSLRGFALICARQFGACIMQRDSDADEPPKLREESPYYAESLAQAEARAAELATITLWEAEKAAQVEYESRCESHKQIETERTEARNRYNAVLSQVVAWQPPSPDHQALKDLMVQQLTEARRFDCDFSDPYPIRRSAEKYLAEERERARKECDRSAQGLGEERERVAKANAWITALYESLPVLAPDGDQGRKT